jgi:recombinational DNA repair ATPase RecF
VVSVRAYYFARRKYFDLKKINFKAIYSKNIRNYKRWIDEQKEKYYKNHKNYKFYC